MAKINSNPSGITVLGVGNILLSDEGIGVHIINALQEQYTFEPEISLLDGGTMGMELLTFMEDTKKLLLVDAISGGEAPGTVYYFNHEDVERYFSGGISVHEVGMQDILLLRRMQDNPIEEAVVVGVEPESLEVGLEPTKTVEARIPEIMAQVIAQLESWGVTASKV